MPYTKTTWVDGSAPAISAANLNKIEQGIADALPIDGTVAMTGKLVTIGGSTATPSIVSSLDADTGILFPSAGRMSIASNGTEVIYCHSNLNVAIGHNAPTAKLDVSGAIQVRGAAAAGSVISITPDATTGTNGTTIANSFASGGYGPLYIQNGGSTRMTILSGGNVGVGTTSPAELLEVSGSSTGTIYTKVTNTDATGNAGLTLANTGTSGRSFQLYVPGNSAASYKNSLVVYDTGASAVRLLLNASGYLLIGYTTNNGAYPLQVNGQIFATSATIATSDARYKQNVTQLDGALDIVKALNPVQFDWKEHPVHKFNTDNPTVGFLAQEVSEVLANKPYLNSIIKKNETEFEVDGETVKEEFLGIAEGNLIAILTKAVKELTAKVEALEEKLKA